MFKRSDVPPHASASQDPLILVKRTRKKCRNLFCFSEANFVLRTSDSCCPSTASERNERTSVSKHCVEAKLT